MKTQRIAYAAVFVFAAFIEIAQHYKIIKLLGLENNALLSTIIGTTFSYLDLLCYAVGCVLFWAVEKAVLYFIQRRQYFISHYR